MAKKEQEMKSNGNHGKSMSKTNPDGIRRKAKDKEGKLNELPSKAHRSEENRFNTLPHKHTNH
jgi:hypothetical protein